VKLKVWGSSGHVEVRKRRRNEGVLLAERGKKGVGLSETIASRITRLVIRERIGGKTLNRGAARRWGRGKRGRKLGAMTGVERNEMHGVRGGCGAGVKERYEQLRDQKGTDGPNLLKEKRLRGSLGRKGLETMKQPAGAEEEREWRVGSCEEDKTGRRNANDPCISTEDEHDFAKSTSAIRSTPQVNEGDRAGI